MDIKFVMPTIAFVLEKASSSGKSNPRKIVRIHPCFFEPTTHIVPQSLVVKTAGTEEKLSRLRVNAQEPAPETPAILPRTVESDSDLLLVSPMTLDNPVLPSPVDDPWDEVPSDVMVEVVKPGSQGVNPTSILSRLRRISNHNEHKTR